MTTPISRRPEVVAAVRAFLIEERNRPDHELPRYAEVAAVYGGVARAVAPVLNAVARDCADKNEPDLSALVVLTQTGLPVRLNGNVVNPNDRRVLATWQTELRRICDHDWPGASANTGAVPILVSGAVCSGEVAPTS